MAQSFPAPFAVIGPDPPQRAVILTISHAGRDYPADLLARARVPRPILERLEDRYVDALAAAAVDAGFTVVIARIARAFIDLNRAADEWDTALVSDAQPTLASTPRIRSGLGIVPRRLHPVGDLWRTRLTLAQLEARISWVHRPYHDAVARLIGQVRDRWGAAAMIDLHSMPPQSAAHGRSPPQWVIGDRYGATASAELVDRLIAAAEGAGLVASRNAPYAGAYGITRHADRGSAIEAVQIEFDRSLYLGSDNAPDRNATARFARLVLTMAEIAEQRVLSVPPFAIAAE